MVEPYRVNLRQASAICARDRDDLSRHIPDTPRYKPGTIELYAKDGQDALRKALAGLNRIGQRPMWAYEKLLPYLDEIVRHVEPVKPVEPAKQLTLL